MEVQALPLVVPEKSGDKAQSDHKISVWAVIGNTLGLGIFLLSLLAFFDLLARVPVL